MWSTTLLTLVAALPVTLAQVSGETVLGVYMFHRHGDRTPKSLTPVNLTDLGYRQVYTSGQHYRSRYIDSASQLRISGINTDEVYEDQVQASAPLDPVLQNSAQGFLQALYPPIGADAAAASETLANGSTVTAPMDGYQLIPINLVESGSGSEDSSWLQSTSDCYKAELSSNEYFESEEYMRLLESTEDFYGSLVPVLEPVFNDSTASFKDAYLIWDYLNVATIHNATINNGDLLTPSTMRQLYGLANEHEWGLAYNTSEPIRSIAGSQLAAEVVQFLDEVIDVAGAQDGYKFAIQFGAYASFSAFFGLAQLPFVNPDFEGVTNYASSMAFEMFTNASLDVFTTNYPSEDEIYVRFLYRNGTATEETPPEIFPLFGTGEDVLSYSDFKNGMNTFAIGDTASWCHACGNTTGICAPYTNDASSSEASEGGNGSACSNGLTTVVNAVIGAMVTLAVVLGLEALLMVVLGLRVVSKKRLAQGTSGSLSPGSSGGKA